MKKRRKQVFRVLSWGIAMYLLASVALFTFLSLSREANELSLGADDLAVKYATNATATLNRKLDELYGQIEALTEKVPPLTTEEEFEAFGEEAVLDGKYFSIILMKDSYMEYRFGDGAGELKDNQVRTILQADKLSTSGLFYEKLLGKLSAMYYCPIAGNETVNHMVIEPDMMKVIGNRVDLNFHALLYSLTDYEGTPLLFYSEEPFAYEAPENLYSYLNRVAGNENAVDPLFSEVYSREPVSRILSVGGVSYAVVMVPVNLLGTEYTATYVYVRDDLSAGKYEIYRDISLVVLLLSTVLAMTATVLLISKFRSDRKITIIDEFDPVLGCNSYNRFLQEAQVILNKNRFSNFAVVYLSLKNYISMQESFDKKTVEDALGHVANVLKKSTGESETFGHIADEKFVIMLHYTDINYLSEKIKIISALISYFDKLRNQNYTMLSAVGVFIARSHDAMGNIVDSGIDPADMVNRAKIASIVHVKAYEKPFIIYDSSIGSTYVEETQVESKMSLALENREFKLFFQPKYNAVSKGLDSAEVLVRWYNAQTKIYQSPAAFIRIFETNGFIIKLDHYVFRETCVFLKEMSDAGQRTVPLSVNVSRATAIDPGFVDFYIQTKNEFGIPDNYLTLEFTETFAFDSYATLSSLILNLKEHGFLCSIDDFGVGYSAINILKELPVDEIKVDKALLDSGSMPQKDKIVLEGVYRMVNEIGLKLIQEGVETEDVLDMVVHMGCNVIQGYYYAKPMYTTDFIDFINDDHLNKRFRSTTTNT